MKKTPVVKLLTSAGIGAALTFGSAVQAADVVIGVPNWPSVLATAHVLKGALEDNPVSYTHLTLPTICSV